MAPQEGGNIAPLIESLEAKIDTRIFVEEFCMADSLLNDALAIYPDYTGLRESADLLVIMQQFASIERSEIFDEYFADSEADVLEQRVDELIATGRLVDTETELAYAPERYPDHVGLMRVLAPQLGR